MKLTENEIDYFYTAILEEIKPNLIGSRLVAKATPLPVGVQSVTTTKLKNLRGNAMIGRKTEDIPREIGDIERITVPIIPHSHGFKLDYQDVEAAKRTGLPLETTVAKEHARVLAESIERMILNGLPKYGIEGIYANAQGGDDGIYTVPKGEEWDKPEAHVYESVVDMVSKLEETSRYKAQWLMLSSRAYYKLMKTNKLGTNSFLEMIEGAGLFNNGKNIFKAPLPANQELDPIIPEGTGLIGDYGNHIAERYTQAHYFGGIEGDEEVVSEIDFRAIPLNENNTFVFNLESYQGMSIHFNEAFLRIENLLSTPAHDKKGTKKD